MGAKPRAAVERLALLLAGGGARCRRLLAAVADEQPPLVALAARGAPSALIASAREIAREQAPDLLARVERGPWRWIVPGEAGFPALLAEITDPPLGLFVRGRWPGGPAVAVVGSRRASPYGLQVARLLGEELGRAGVVVVSGMARGVDAAAHQGALSAAGATAAVWGTGPDRLYPPEHGALADEIAAAGALLTEYPPGTPPRRHHFPQRNRILAGLSAAVVVVEAAARSGALVTARLALDEGREVLAVPGSVFSSLSIGPNALLRLGARPALTPADVFEAVGLPAPARLPSPPLDPLLELVPPGDALAVDELARRAELPVEELLPRLLEAELAGTLERLADGRYCRRTGLSTAAREPK